MSSGSGESNDVSAGETVKWSSGDGDADNDSIGLIVSVMVDSRCQSWEGKDDFLMQRSQRPRCHHEQAPDNPSNPGKV